MKPHYRKFKGYRRHPGRRGRPVYRVQMSESEVNDLRLLRLLIGALVSVLCAGALWVVTLI